MFAARLADCIYPICSARSQEAQLIRQSHRAHDSHFHLALYFIHPDSITSHPPAPKRTNKISLGRSMSTPHLARKGKGGGGEPVWDASEKIGHLEPDGEPAPTETVDRQEEELGLSEVDLRAIKRLSKRVNVLVVRWQLCGCELGALADHASLFVDGRSSLDPTHSPSAVCKTSKTPSSATLTALASALASLPPRRLPRLPSSPRRPEKPNPTARSAPREAEAPSTIRPRASTRPTLLRLRCQRATASAPPCPLRQQAQPTACPDCHPPRPPRSTFPVPAPRPTKDPRRLSSISIRSALPLLRSSSSASAQRRARGWGGKSRSSICMIMGRGAMVKWAGRRWRNPRVRTSRSCCHLRWFRQRGLGVVRAGRSG